MKETDTKLLDPASVHRGTEVVDRRYIRSALRGNVPAIFKIMAKACFFSFPQTRERLCQFLLWPYERTFQGPIQFAATILVYSDQGWV